MYLINYYSDRGYRTMESTTNQKSITRPKNRGQEWKYDSNIPQNSGRSPLVMLKFIFKGQLGSPGSFAGNPGGVRVGPCLATGLKIRPLSDDCNRSRLRSSNSSDVFVPRTKTKMGDRAFEVAGPRTCTWNSLTATIRETKILHAFKKQLKLNLIGNPEY